MIKLRSILFKPRQVPAWWSRFNECYPFFANAVAIAGLAWICFSIAMIVSSADSHGTGKVVETIGATSWSEDLTKNASGWRSVYHRLFPAEIRALVSQLYGNVALYLIIPFVMLLELLFPSKPSQPLVGKGFLQDAVWFVGLAPIKVFILFPLASVISSVLNEYMPFLVIQAAVAWPVYIKVIAAIFLGELLDWSNHFLRHKIRTLWYFHAIHHSQKEMNVFTDDRAHAVDLVVGSLFTYIPFFIFQVPNLYAVTVIILYMGVHNRFIHANLKVNLGWLGWLIASPQFHRIHHSVEETHRDKNFGRTLSIFDHLFGTAYSSRHVYPETGIADIQFPDESKVRIRQLPGNWFTQTVYPFMQMFGQKLGSFNFSFFKKMVYPGERQDASEQVNITEEKS